MKNPIGQIFKQTIERRGKKVIVFDVRKRYIQNGVTRSKTKRCYTKAEAIIALQNLPNAIGADKIITVRTDYFFSELVEYYKKEYVKPAVFVNGRKVAGFQRNLKNIEKILKELSGSFGKVQIKTISYEDLRKFAETISQQKTERGDFPAVSTVNEKLSLLRRLFNVAIQMNWMDANPFKRGKPLIVRSAETVRNRMLNFDEEKRLLDACIGRREHLKSLIICALDTAMRKGEIFNLTWNLVDLNERVIYITDSEEKSKTGKAGILPMTTRLFDILKEREKYARDEFVFKKFDYKRSFGSACKLAELEDLHFHDLRGTAATRMLMAGVSETLVMKITRHTQFKTFFNHYTNIDLQGIQNVGLSLDNLIAKADTKADGENLVSTGIM
jgi:integrase